MGRDTGTWYRYDLVRYGMVWYGGCGGGVGKCVGVWGGGKKDVWGVEKCGQGCRRVYGVSGEVCWRVGKNVGRGMGEV